MANCPNCGSDHITLKRETNVSWGRAIAGWALFGVVGGAIGAVTGEDRNVNACLNCGTSWKAADLYKLLEVIKMYTNNTINLSQEKDRIYMDRFTSEVGTYIESTSSADKKAEALIKQAEEEVGKSVAIPFVYGCFLSISMFFTGLSIIFSSAGAFAVSIVILLAPPVLGIWIGNRSAKANEEKNNQKIEIAKKNAEEIKNASRDLLDLSISDFINKHPFY
jgi:hypothetical protein